MSEVTYTAVATGTNARGEKVFSVTDSDGNGATLSLTKDGRVLGEDGFPIGTNFDEDYVAIRALMQAELSTEAVRGYTAKTAIVERKGLMGRPLSSQTRHQVLCANGEVLTSVATIEVAEKIAKELNDFEANPPKFGDLEAEFIRIAGQTE